MGFRGGEDERMHGMGNGKRVGRGTANKRKLGDLDLRSGVCEEAGLLVYERPRGAKDEL